MRLQKLHVMDFQGVRFADLELGGLTMVYGPNGSGKSSLADALLYGLTGETARGRVLADAIREGAKSLAVTVECDHATYGRERSNSSGKETVNGAKAKAGSIEAHLGETGVTQAQLRAALRSGHLLTMTPAELHGLFVELCGAELGEGAIDRAVKEAGIDEAFKIAEIRRPATMDAFPIVAASAEERRRQGKRDLERLRGDLERLPEPAEAEGEAEDLDALMRRRDEALTARARKAGASEAKLAELREELARLESLPEWTEADEEALLVAKKAEAEARKAAGEAERMVEKIAEHMAGLKPSEKKPAKTADALDKLISSRREDEAKAREEMGRIEEEGKRIAALLAKLDGETCPTCGQDATGLSKALEEQKADAKKRWKLASTEAEAIAVQIAELERERHWYEAKALEKTKGETDKALAKAQASAEEAAKKAASLEDRRDTLAERRRIPAVKAAIEEAEAALALDDADDLPEIEERIRKAEAAAQALRSAAQRDAITKEIAETEKRVDALDAIAKACGPKGIPARLMEEMIGPFVELANDALAAIFPGAEVAVETEGGLALRARIGGITLAPDQLSDGERTRFLFALQAAVGLLSGVHVLILDRCELIDPEGKRLLMRWVSRRVSDGWQVLMLSSAPAPAAPQPGIAAYRMEDGRAEQITAQPSEAA